MNRAFQRPRQVSFDGECDFAGQLFIEPRCYGYVDVSASTNAHGTAGGGNIFDGGSIFGNSTQSASTSQTPDGYALGNTPSVGGVSIWLILAFAVPVVGLVVFLILRSRR